MLEPLSNTVIGLAISVHKQLGPGLLESVYETCRCHELLEMGINFHRQLPIKIEYKGVFLDAGYRADIIVEESLILELKTVEKITSLHHAQLLTYMKLGKFRTGILLNFNSELLKDGMKRFVL